MGSQGGLTHDDDDFDNDPEGGRGWYRVCMLWKVAAEALLSTQAAPPMPLTQIQVEIVGRQGDPAHHDDFEDDPEGGIRLEFRWNQTVQMSNWIRIDGRV